MGLFGIFGSSSKKKNRRRKGRDGRPGRDRDRGRRRIDDDYPEPPRRRRPPEGRGRSGDKRRRRPRRPPEDEYGERRRPPRERRSKDGGKRRPPKGDRERRRREDGGGREGRRERERPRRRREEDAFEDQDDVFVIKPEGDQAKVERKKGPGKSFKDGKYEISVGTPTLSGEGTTGEGGILQTVLKTRVTGDLKPALKEARLKKVEKTITEMQMKVQNLEENTGVMRTDLAEIKESVSRMEIAVNDVEDIKEEYNNMEKSLRELSALYDLLSSYTNPFIENIDLPSRSGAGNEAGDKASDEKGEDSDFEFEELSSDINPFVDDMDTKRTSKKEGKDHMVKGEPVMDINKDFWMLKWAKYISIKVRPSQVHKLLDYYRDIGWINKDIEEKMLTYFDGARLDSQGEDMIDSDTIITEDGKVITEESEDAWKMSMDDHSKSLEYIGKIKSDSPIEKE